MKHPFSDQELTQIFETALVALNDGKICDKVADNMDASDLSILHAKLNSFMNPLKIKGSYYKDGPSRSILERTKTSIGTWKEVHRRKAYGYKRQWF